MGRLRSREAPCRCEAGGGWGLAPGLQNHTGVLLGPADPGFALESGAVWSERNSGSGSGQERLGMATVSMLTLGWTREQATRRERTMDKGIEGRAVAAVLQSHL